MLGVHNENACRGDDDVVDVSPRAGDAPIVEDLQTINMAQGFSETSLADRATGPSTRGLRFVIQRQHRATYEVP